MKNHRRLFCSLALTVGLLLTGCQGKDQFLDHGAGPAWASPMSVGALGELTGCRVVIPPSTQNTVFVGVGVEQGATTPAPILLHLGFTHRTELRFDDNNDLAGAWELSDNTDGTPHRIRLVPTSTSGTWRLIAQWDDGSGSVRQMELQHFGDLSTWDSTDRAYVFELPVDTVSGRRVQPVLLWCDRGAALFVLGDA